MDEKESLDPNPSSMTTTTTLTIEEVRRRLSAVLVEPEDDWLAHAERMIENYQSFLRKRTVYDITTLGGRLRAARQLAGMNQPTLARRVGMDQYDISGIERGTRKLPIHKIRPLCMSLGITQDWLLGKSEEGGPKVEAGILRHRLTPSQQHKLSQERKRREAAEEAKRLNAIRRPPRS